jgi:hypothetical protein
MSGRARQPIRDQQIILDAAGGSLPSRAGIICSVAVVSRGDKVRCRRGVWSRQAESLVTSEMPLSDLLGSELPGIQQRVSISGGE